MTEPIRTPKENALRALTVMSGMLSVIMLALLLFVTKSDATAVMFVGSATIVSGLLLHSALQRSSLNAATQLLLVAADVLLTAALAIFLVAAIRA
jgi:uncharacterized membrane protein HdeD (DUF308 family)